MVSKTAVPLLVAGMLVTGISNSLFTKWQDMQCVARCDQDISRHVEFSQPVWQVSERVMGPELACETEDASTYPRTDLADVSGRVHVLGSSLSLLSLSANPSTQPRDEIEKEWGRAVCSNRKRPPSRLKRRGGAANSASSCTTCTTTQHERIPR